MQRVIINKRATLSDRTVDFLLGVLAAMVIIGVLINMLEPSYNERDEGAKSYQAVLEQQMKKAKEGEIGEFFLWPLPDKGEDGDERIFYLVNFGGELFVKENGITFPYGGKRSKLAPSLCICSREKLVSCTRCIDSEHPLRYQGNAGQWILEEGQKVSIEFNDDEYIFTNRF